MSETDADTVRQVGERELSITRRFAAPPHQVFRSFADPALFRRWWAPECFGITLQTCEIDLRTAGSYRLVYAMGETATMAFHGLYIEVVPDNRIVWTNAESAEDSITTVTFEDRNGETLLTFHELYPSLEALDEAEASFGALPMQFDALAALLMDQKPN